MNAHATNGRSDITCVLADDHPPILDCLSRYLEAAGFQVLATALDGVKALDAVRRHEPSVCIADMSMPGLDGLALVTQLAKDVPNTRVLLYSGVADAELAAKSLAAGALGFALKDAPLDQLGEAVETVATGGVYIDPVLGAAMVNARESLARRALSKRECEVLRLLAGGNSYAEMGSVLFLSPDTVRAHAQRAMAKVGARTRTQAVAVALRDGLIA